MSVEAGTQQATFKAPSILRFRSWWRPLPALRPIHPKHPGVSSFVPPGPLEIVTVFVGIIEIIASASLIPWTPDVFPTGLKTFRIGQNFKDILFCLHIRPRHPELSEEVHPSSIPVSFSTTMRPFFKHPGMHNHSPQGLHVWQVSVLSQISMIAVISHQINHDRNAPRSISLVYNFFIVAATCVLWCWSQRVWAVL